MKLTMLGTGNALVTECYNTCFLLEDNGQLFLVDGGGGNTVLHQIRHAGYDWMDIRHIFVTHKHIDHLLGIIWMVRMICQFMDHGEYKGDAYMICFLATKSPPPLGEPISNAWVDRTHHMMYNDKRFVF